MLPGFEPWNHDVESSEFAGGHTDARLAIRLGEVEPDVAAHHLLLEPCDERILLAGNFDPHLLRSIFRNQPEQCIDRLLHGLAFTDAIDPEPVSVRVIRPD